MGPAAGAMGSGKGTPHGPGCPPVLAAGRNLRLQAVFA